MSDEQRERSLAEFKALPREQQLVVLRESLKAIPELQLMFDLKAKIDRNLEVMVTIMENVQGFSEQMESTAIVLYRRLQHEAQRDTDDALE